MTYVGALPRAALHDAMRAADVVLNTSRTEGMCNSILEAMLVGTPVVARSNAGNQMLIEHGATGLLFESPEELVEAASKLLSDDALTRRITDAATARVACALDRRRGAWIRGGRTLRRRRSRPGATTSPSATTRPRGR